MVLALTLAVDVLGNRVEIGTSRAGSWGGTCTCPNGQVYWVGDALDFCGSLACTNGVAGECREGWSFPTRDWYNGRLAECDPPPPPPPPVPASDSACSGTVAYVFLTRGELPLWPVWREYFADCPPGSVVPIMHSQDVSNGSRAVMAARLEPYGGFALPPEQTVQGDLRFSFAMVRAQLRLYGAASRSTATNGCTPRWAVTLSERDAPLRSCAAVHSQLEDKAGVSQLEPGQDTRWIEKPEEVPYDFSPIVQVSQWATMWVPHAAVLAAAEAEIAARWVPTLVAHPEGSNLPRIEVGNQMLWGAFDEWVWVPELARRGLPYHLQGLTFILWCDELTDDELYELDPGFRCEHVDNFDGASPAAFTTRGVASGACRFARNRGYSFSRKFGDGSADSTTAVIDALLAEDCIHAPEVPPPLPPSAPPRLPSEWPQTPPPPPVSPLPSPPFPPIAPPFMPTPPLPPPLQPPAFPPRSPQKLPPPALPRAILLQAADTLQWFTDGVQHAEPMTVMLASSNVLLMLISLLLCCVLLCQSSRPKPTSRESVLQPASRADLPQAGDSHATRSTDCQPLREESAVTVADGPRSLHYVALIKWLSLPLLVVQNSSLFLVMRYSRSMHPDQYVSTVAVFMTENVKLCIAFTMVQFVERKQGACGGFRRLRGQLHLLSTLAVPALCYTVQNNLLFVAVSYLSAAAAQVLVQSKTLWAALFSVILLKKRFGCVQWSSFVLLVLGVVVVQNQDGQALSRSSSPDNGVGGGLVGSAASLAAAALSGFAGVFLERTFNRHAASLWEMNVLLALLALPLQALAIFEFDRVAIAEHGLFHGFHSDTWLVVCIQAAGGLLTAVVIKYAGNMLKSFATSLSLMSTSLIQIPLFGYDPSEFFWVGLALVCTATMMYSLGGANGRIGTAVQGQPGTRTTPVAPEACPTGDLQQRLQAAHKGRCVRVPGLGSRATRFKKMANEETQDVDAEL